MASSLLNLVMVGTYVLGKSPWKRNSLAGFHNKRLMRKQC